jgi:hypothetical protein
VSQLVLGLLHAAVELVPIVISVQRLQLRLREDEAAFASAWNWVDAFLRLEHKPEVHLFLRQAMLARRTVLLIDGLDESGRMRAQIERHVTEVLQPQGHVIFATSRPAGIVDSHFEAFHRLRLSHLTIEQQLQVISHRVDEDASTQLKSYLQDVPKDPQSGRMVTSNPLMLSMVIAVFQLRHGVGMPKSAAELYQVATQAMLARGDMASAECESLLQAVFFEAHRSQQRVITKHHIDVAAARLGSGRERETLLRPLTKRMLQGQMSLLSLLQADPVQLQSSHLTIQEYYVAMAICHGAVLKGPPPWQWSPWWLNVIRIGSEMEAFGVGLHRAAGVQPEVLDLTRSKIGGDRETSLSAVAQLTRAVRVVDLYDNMLMADEIGWLAAGLRVSTTLDELNLSANFLGDHGVLVIVRALQDNPHCKLHSLVLTWNGIGPEGGGVLGHYAARSPLLCKLSLGKNLLGNAGAVAIASALKRRPDCTLRQLELYSNAIGTDGATAIAAYMAASTSLTWLK